MPPIGADEQRLTDYIVNFCARDPQGIGPPLNAVRRDFFHGEPIHDVRNYFAARSHWYLIAPSDKYTEGRVVLVDGEMAAMAAGQRQSTPQPSVVRPAAAQPLACGICMLKFPTSAALALHQGSKKHLSRIKFLQSDAAGGLGNRPCCIICKTVFPTPGHLSTHLESQKHQRMLSKMVRHVSDCTDCMVDLLGLRFRGTVMAQWQIGLKGHGAQLSMESTEIFGPVVSLCHCCSTFPGPWLVPLLQLLKDMETHGTLTANKAGMAVSVPQPLDGLAPGEVRTVSITVANNSPQQKVLSSVCQLQAIPQASYAETGNRMAQSNFLCTPFHPSDEPVG